MKDLAYETIDAGVVIQIIPEAHRFSGTFWIVEEMRDWGVLAYCTIPGQTGVAYIRLTWEQFAIVGPAPFRLGPTRVVKGEDEIT